MESAGYPTPAHSAKAIRGPTPQSSPMPATATAHSGSLSAKEPRAFEPHGP